MSNCALRTKERNGKTKTKDQKMYDTPLIPADQCPNNKTLWKYQSNFQKRGYIFIADYGLFVFPMDLLKEHAKSKQKAAKFKRNICSHHIFDFVCVQLANSILLIVQFHLLLYFPFFLTFSPIGKTLFFHLGKILNYFLCLQFKCGLN